MFKNSSSLNLNLNRVGSQWREPFMGNSSIYDPKRGFLIKFLIKSFQFTRNVKMFNFSHKCNIHFLSNAHFTVRREARRPLSAGAGTIQTWMSARRYHHLECIKALGPPPPAQAAPRRHPTVSTAFHTCKEWILREYFHAFTALVHYIQAILGADRALCKQIWPKISYFLSESGPSSTQKSQIT